MLPSSIIFDNRDICQLSEYDIRQEKAAPLIRLVYLPGCQARLKVEVPTHTFGHFSGTTTIFQGPIELTKNNHTKPVGQELHSISAQSCSREEVQALGN